MKGTRFATFEAMLAHHGAPSDPVEGEQAGPPCRICDVIPRYRKNGRGVFRIQMVHDAGKHRTSRVEGDLEIEPPTRIGHWSDDL